MRGRSAWLALATCAACRREPPVGAPANHAGGEGVPDIAAVLDVCDTSKPDAFATWPAPKYVGQQFELVGRAGPVATVRISNRTYDCDDCPGPSAGAEIVEVMGKLTDSCYLAIGPLVRPLPRALRIDAPDASQALYHTVTPWIPTEQFDLDGDGKPEIERVIRCADVVPSGCKDHVCDRTCYGVRQRGDVRDEQCHGFVPDVDDCKP